MNNWVLLVLGVLVLACEPEGQRIPALKIDAADVGLSSREGQLIWHGQSFSGYRYALYPNADTAELIPFWLGKEEGIARYWYPGRLLREKRFFKMGKKEGVHYGWWENGQRSFEYHFKADLHQGKALSWHPNGQLSTHFNYEQGQETGLQKAWYDNGNLRLNYVARNGRQFGLTGVKNCATVWDASVGKFIEKPVADPMASSTPQ